MVGFLLGNMSNGISALCHDLRQVVICRPSQSERLAYLKNGLTLNKQILLGHSLILSSATLDMTSLAIVGCKMHFLIPNNIKVREVGPADKESNSPVTV